jgi:hypothetical protein
VTTPTTVQVRLQIRADTAANWASVNPILLANELGLESDTKKFKIGNGSNTWSGLAYFPSIVSGGTVLGNLEIGSTGTLTFEGSTADDFETTLGVVDPTADRTILLPNQSGTVVVGGNASITNADIAANAEIAVSKLADGAARQLLQTDAAGTGVEWTDNVDVPGTLDVTSTATFDSIASHPLGTAGAPTVTFTGDTNTGIYSPGADQVAISTNGTGRLFVDASGNVGVRVAPSYNFDVSGSARIKTGATSTPFIVSTGGDSQGTVRFGSSGNEYSINGGADYLGVIFNSNGSERMRLDSSGRLGLGASSPSEVLDVRQPVATGTYQARIAVQNTDQRTIIGSYWRAGVGQYSVIQATNAAETTSQGLAINPAGGNVGIGSTVANSKLSIGNGASTNDGLTITFTGDNSTLARFYADTATGQVSIGGIAASYYPAFYSAGSERARIDTSGRLLVGTSSSSANASIVCQGTSGGSAGAAQLWLQRGQAASGIGAGDTLGRINFADNAGNLFAWIDGQTDGAAGTNDYPSRLVFSTTADGASSPTERMRIGSNGDITFSTHPAAAGVTGKMLMGPSTFYGMYFEVSIDGSGFPNGLIQGPNSRLTLRCGGTGGVYLGTGSTSWTAVSDERAKTNLQPIENGLNKVSTLRAFTGEFKGDESGTRRPFLIAQDVEKVLPEAVDSQNPEQLGLSYSDVIPLLVAALKESKERIENLEAKVAALEAA